MRDFKLRIMASDHTVYDGPAKSVTLPTPNGSIGVMAQHVNYITAVVPGEVSYIPSESAEGTEAGQKQHVIVSDGILKVENGEAIILVDTAETPAEIDERRAKLAEEKARQAIKEADSHRDLTLARGELSRAMSRLGASRHKHKL